MENYHEYLQAVLDYYDDKLSRLDKKTRGLPLDKDQHEIYDYYREKRQEVYKIMHQSFFSEFGESAGIPKEYRRNELGERLN